MKQLIFSFFACIGILSLLSCASAPPRKLRGNEDYEEMFRYAVLSMLSQRYADAQKGFKGACEQKDKLACKMLDDLNARLARNPVQQPDGMPILKCIDSVGCFSDRNLYHGDYKKDCDGGSVDACRKLALQYWSGEKEGDAEPLFERHCQAKDAASCLGMGLVKTGSYKWGAASQFFRQACDAGLESGCERYAMNEFQHGDKQLAKEAWAKSCERGYLASCWGVVIWEGADAATIERKKELWKQYCDRGDVYSCFANATQNPEKWDELKRQWRKACRLGDFITCGYYAYAFDYIEGTGKPDNTGTKAGTIIVMGLLFGGAGAGAAAGVAASDNEQNRRVVLSSRPRKLDLF